MGRFQDEWKICCTTGLRGQESTLLSSLFTSSVSQQLIPGLILSVIIKNLGSHIERSLSRLTPSWVKQPVQWRPELL